MYMYTVDSTNNAHKLVVHTSRYLQKPRFSIEDCVLLCFLLYGAYHFYNTCVTALMHESMGVSRGITNQIRYIHTL